MGPVYDNETATTWDTKPSYQNAYLLEIKAARGTPAKDNKLYSYSLNMQCIDLNLADRYSNIRHTSSSDLKQYLPTCPPFHFYP